MGAITPILAFISRKTNQKRLIFSMLSIEYIKSIYTKFEQNWNGHLSCPPVLYTVDIVCCFGCWLLCLFVSPLQVEMHAITMEMILTTHGPVNVAGYRLATSPKDACCC